jgi:hypothetical protein
MKVVPRRRGTKLVVSEQNQLSTSRLSHNFKTTFSLSYSLPPTPVPVRPTKAPPILLSRKIVPQRQDTKNVISLNELSMSRSSPMLETALVLSTPLLPALLLLLKSLPSLEEGDNDSETEERQLVDAAVSKIDMSVVRYSSMFHAAAVLPQSTSASRTQPVPHVPCSSMPKPAHSLPVGFSAHNRIKPSRPAVRDKRTPYPNMASSCFNSNFPLLSLKTEYAKRHGLASVATEDRRKIPSPDAWTAPSPTCLAQAHSAFSLLREV